MSACILSAQKTGFIWNPQRAKKKEKEKDIDLQYILTCFYIFLKNYLKPLSECYFLSYTFQKEKKTEKTLVLTYK